MAQPTNRLLPLVVFTLALSACATTTGLRGGEQAELAQDYDRAVVEYTRALERRPDDRAAQQGLDRSRLRAAQDHYTRGRRLYGAANLNEALVELELAAELNGADTNVRDLLESVRTQLRAKTPLARAGRTDLETRMPAMMSSATNPTLF